MSSIGSQSTVSPQFFQNAAVDSGSPSQRIDQNLGVYIPQPIKGWQWQQRAIRKIDSWEIRLDEKIPNIAIQNKIDYIGQEIEKTFSPLVKFNNWLNKNEQGSWYKQLAIFLAKLPIKAACNIIQQLYTIIRGIIYGMIHPLQAMNSVAKLFVMLPYEFSRPEMWSKMGAGIVGTSLAEAAIMGGLGSLIVLGIGGALIVGGISAGTLKALLEAEKGQRQQAVGQYLLNQSKELPETLLTSFYMGLIIGGIRRAVKEIERKQQAQIQKKQIQQKNELHALDETTSKRAPDFYQVVELCRNNPDRYPPIAYAVKLGRHDVVKFLIDHNESVSAQTPGFTVWHDFASDISDHTDYRIVGTQPGYTALELAIQRGDVEMVKILTSYNPTNRALITESILRRHVWLNWNGQYWLGETNPSNICTPLSTALAHGNKEIIGAIINSYTTPEALSETFGFIRTAQQESLMRVWLERYTFLSNGTQIPIADETVKMFLAKSLQEAITAGDTSHVLQLLEKGWIVSKQDLVQLFAAKDPSVIKALMNGAHLQNGVNPMMVAVEVGSVDVLRTYIQQGVSFEGLLLHAVQQKQKSIVEYLLELPLGQNEIKEACAKAYELRAYEIMELLEAGRG